MSLSRLTTLMMAVLVGLVGSAPTRSWAEHASKNGDIVFASERAGKLDIWSMQSNGQSPVNLTADPFREEYDPNWRSDGRKIAFISDRVTPTNPTGDFEIFVMNADGARIEQVTFNDVRDESPSWSPDGRMIAFHRNLDPLHQQPYELGDYDLYTMAADGSHQRNLTQSPGIQDKWPDWSEDGHRIVFDSNRDGDREIFTMRLDGTRVRQLTFNTGLEDGFPAWSPNGNKIAYTSASTSGQDMFGSWEIHTMRADGRKQTRLTQNTALDFQPAWSPDGSLIVFTSFRDQNGEIYTMQADGRHQVNQTRNSAFDIDPDWQPLPMQHRRVNG